jgi:hypothetical protein
MEDTNDLKQPSYCCECMVADKCNIEAGEVCAWYNVEKEDTDD